MPSSSCTHLDSIEIVDAPGDVAGCEECLAERRRAGCTCGCARRAGTSAAATTRPTGTRPLTTEATGHPIIRSVEPGEDWSWCYVDELMFRLPPREPRPPDASRGRPPARARATTGCATSSPAPPSRTSGSRPARRRPTRCSPRGGRGELALPVVIDGDDVIARGHRRAAGGGVGADRRRRRARTTTWRSSAPGPAGLAAAVYAASDGLSTVVVERDLPGRPGVAHVADRELLRLPRGHRRRRARPARRPPGRGLRRGAGAPARRHRQRAGPTGVRARGRRRRRGRGTGRRSPRPGWSGGGWRSTGVDELLGRGVYYGAGRSEAAQCGGDDVRRRRRGQLGRARR